MDGDQLHDAIVRFQVMRAQESQQHLAALLRCMRELIPTLDDARLSRVAVALDEEITRANLRWMRSTLGDPGDPTEVGPALRSRIVESRAG